MKSIERIAGAAVGRAAHAQGWVVFLGTASETRSDQIDTALLDALERRMAALGSCWRSGSSPRWLSPRSPSDSGFAKAVASRLNWPFVELFPSRMAHSPGGLAGALRSTFEVIADLEHVVVFIDEVEEVASRRRGDPPSPTQGVTNELLKLVAEFREREGRLLICATNFIRGLDAAFLRPGRFDYVIPIGLPDPDARRSIWTRYVPAGVVDRIDIAALVSASEGLTPADIEYAARGASQEALARALRNSPATAADRSTGAIAIVAPAVDLRTDHYLSALAATRATVSPDAARAFLEDIATIGRL